MLIDNPATRLLAILKAAKQMDPNASCKDSWNKLLDSGDDIALLMSRLGRVMELPRQVNQAMVDSFPDKDGLRIHWQGQVNAAFMTNNLGATFNTFLQHIDPHTITYLEFTSELLQKVSDVGNLSNADVDKYRELLNTILVEVLASDLDGHLKTYVVRSIRKIINSLDEYKLTGVTPILDSIDALVGHALPDKEYRNFLSDHALGQRLFECVSTMANVITVSVGLPQLTCMLAQLGN